MPRNIDFANNIYNFCKTLASIKVLDKDKLLAVKDLQMHVINYNLKYCGLIEPILISDVIIAYELDDQYIKAIFNNGMTCSFRHPKKNILLMFHSDIPPFDGKQWWGKQLYSPFFYEDIEQILNAHRVWESENIKHTSSAAN